MTKFAAVAALGIGGGGEQLFALARVEQESDRVGKKQNLISCGRDYH
jgi:hypothetical protein